MAFAFSLRRMDYQKWRLRKKWSRNRKEKNSWISLLVTFYKFCKVGHFANFVELFLSPVKKLTTVTVRGDTGKMRGKWRNKKKV
jgi:hypothetical protein